MRPHLAAAWATVALLVCSCQEVSEGRAYELVKRYNDTVSQAYRLADVTAIDAVVAPNSRDGKNLTGLIGVRFDAGVTLDAHLLSLEVEEVALADGLLSVRTVERWRHRDLEVGTGRQLGAESFDTYEILYTFEKHDGAWLVTETSFASPPQVGRKSTGWGMDWDQMHGQTLKPAPETTAP